MQQTFFGAFLRIVLIGLLPIQSSFSTTLSSILIDSQQFYSAYPEQLPLGEQFAEAVEASGVTVSNPPQDTLRIVIQLVGPESTLKNQAILETFKQRMRELRIDYRLDTFTESDYLGDKEGALQGYLKIAAMDPDYLLVTGVHAIQSRIVERFLLPRKPKVIVYDMATPLSSWENHPPLIYIGFDEKLATSQLALAIHKKLPVKSTMHALVLPSGYLSHTRCDTFLDRTYDNNRKIQVIRHVENNRKLAYQAALELLSASPVDFVFSCTQAISDGVMMAIKALGLEGKTQTNTWRLSSEDIKGLRDGRLLMSYLFMQDELAVGMAEAVKRDLEGARMPRLYMANGHLVYMPLSDKRLGELQRQAYRYSRSIWQK
ncbi:substrate-binding domain-containing protein [Marinomonas dokdonensis]|uniref:substrate-binding domain-containing protein n=1 Tax=Marinomonas dokdonensis TaxID=328224 RepID=UPI0040556978